MLQRMSGHRDPLPAPSPRLRLRLLFEGDAMLGPGKVDLLELIRDQGSISAAGRSMGMSWKRAWSLVDELNRAFRLPLVEAARGGAAGGGAHLTATGTDVLALYRRLESRLAEEGGADLRALNALVRGASDVSNEK